MIHRPPHLLDVQFRKPPTPHMGGYPHTLLSPPIPHHGIPPSYFLSKGVLPRNGHPSMPRHHSICFSSHCSCLHVTCPLFVLYLFRSFVYRRLCIPFCGFIVAIEKPYLDRVAYHGSLCIRCHICSSSCAPQPPRLGLWRPVIIQQFTTKAKQHITSEVLYLAKIRNQRYN